MDQEKKLLLLGPGGAGKTCMRSVIFENYFPRDALRLGITLSMDHNRVHILRNLFLNLIDCGGQPEYVQEYLSKQREYIFRNVAVMLFAFDVTSFMGNPEDSEIPNANNWTRKQMLNYFRDIMKKMKKYSPDAHLFVLLHKIDLLSVEEQESVLNNAKLIIDESMDEDCLAKGKELPVVYGTSIWTTSLYKAYSSVVRTLIPSRERLVDCIRNLGQVSHAVEVALFDRSTFLCLAHVTRRLVPVPEREDTSGNEEYEVLRSNADERTAQVSETIKHFKLSSMNNNADWQGLTIEAENFTAILTAFTGTVYVLLVCDDPSISVALHLINISTASQEFQTFLQSKDPEAGPMSAVL